MGGHVRVSIYDIHGPPGLAHSIKGQGFFCFSKWFALMMTTTSSFLNEHA